VARELAPAADGRRGLVLSASKEIEPGVRAMLVLADGLFRLDVAVSDDTIRTVVRNLSSGELTFEDPVDQQTLRRIVFGEALAYRPSSSKLRFSLGGGDDRVSVEVVLGTLRFEERGTVRVTAQVSVRAG
jgi:hypothetical protein